MSKNFQTADEQRQEIEMILSQNNWSLEDLARESGVHPKTLRNVRFGQKLGGASMNLIRLARFRFESGEGTSAPVRTILREEPAEYRRTPTDLERFPDDTLQTELERLVARLAGERGEIIRQIDIEAAIKILLEMKIRNGGRPPERKA